MAGKSRKGKATKATAGAVASETQPEQQLVETPATGTMPAVENKTETPAILDRQMPEPSFENNGDGTGAIAAENTEGKKPVEPKLDFKPPVDEESSPEFIRTSGVQPAPVVPIAEIPQETIMTAASSVQTNRLEQSANGTPPIVQGTPVNPLDNLRNALGASKARITEIDAQMGQLDAQHEKTKSDLDAEHEKAKEALDIEKTSYIEQLESMGVTWEETPKPKVPGRRGRKPGSTNAVKVPTVHATSTKKSKKGDGPSARELVIAFVNDAEGPVTLKEIRNYLKENGKVGSNPSIETSRLVDMGILKKNAKKEFLRGRKSA